MDQQKTLQFLHDLSEQAFTEARSGDTLLANKLAGNPATQFYYTNVHSIQSISPDAFARNYPQFLKAADDMREAYEAQDKAEQRMNAVEGKLDDLLKAVQALTEAKAQPEPTPEPAPKGKGKVKEQPDEAAEDAPADETK